MGRETFQKPFERNVFSNALRAHPLGNGPAALAFSDALRRHRLAEARLTLSVDEGRPGGERNALVEDHSAAQNELTYAYVMARTAGAVREGITPHFISHDEARKITTALNQHFILATKHDRPESELAMIADLEELFTHAETEAVDIFVR